MEASMVRNDILTSLDIVNSRLAEFMGFDNIVHNDIGHVVGEKEGKLRFIPRCTESWLHAMDMVRKLNEHGYVLQLEQYKHGGMLYWDAVFVSADSKTEYEFAQASSPLEAISMAAYALVINYDVKTLSGEAENGIECINPIVQINDEHIVVTAIKKIGSITPVVDTAGQAKYMFYLFVEGFQQPFRQYFATLEEAVKAKSDILDKICAYCNK